ncbi:hypothetical protein Hdeb2414_s0020g00557931 [Helianthus debilis subsp. tardiflorus]
MPTHDEVYIPKRKSKVVVYSTLLNNPPVRVFTLVFRLTLGFPLYLLTKISGKNYGRFDGWSIGQPLMMLKDEFIPHLIA